MSAPVNNSNSSPISTYILPTEKKSTTSTTSSIANLEKDGIASFGVSSVFKNSEMKIPSPRPNATTLSADLPSTETISKMLQSTGISSGKANYIETLKDYVTIGIATKERLRCFERAF